MGIPLAWTAYVGPATAMFKGLNLSTLVALWRASQRFQNTAAELKKLLQYYAELMIICRPNRIESI
jgi:hypothetical protein